MGKAARYTNVVVTDAWWVIRDIGPWNEHLTVTNDAQRVVSELAPRIGKRRLLYYDSDGALDELLITDGKFAGFAPYRGNEPA